MPSHIERMRPALSADNKEALDVAGSENIVLGKLSSKTQGPEIDIGGEHNTGEDQQYLKGWRLYGLILG